MVWERINTLREKLDEMIASKAPYDEIYKVSVELDKWIAKYYLEV